MKVVLLKSILSFCICFTLLINHSYATNKDIPVVQVSPEEMEQILADKENVSKVERIPLDPEEEKTIETKTNEGNWGSVFQGLSEEGTLIVLAVVGTVLVVAWIISVPIKLHQVITGKKKYDVINMASMHLVGLSDSSILSRDGDMGSIRYSMLLKRDDEELENNLHTGFSVGVGYFNLKEEDKEKKVTAHNHGLYWLMGPSLILGKNTNTGEFLFGKLDLMAGSAFIENVGFMAKAELSFNVKLKSNVSFGVSAGAEHHQIKKGTGLGTNSDPRGIFGVNLGYFF